MLLVETINSISNLNLTISDRLEQLNCNHLDLGAGLGAGLEAGRGRARECAVVGGRLGRGLATSKGFTEDVQIKPRPKFNSRVQTRERPTAAEAAWWHVVLLSSRSRHDSSSSAKAERSFSAQVEERRQPWGP